MNFIETHCHLDYLKDRPLEETLSLAQNAGIQKIMTISVSPKNWQEVQILSEKYPQIYCTFGIHPHHALEMQVEHWPILEQFIKSSKKLVALGEMGLDYYYNKSPRELQIKVFERQLELAQRYQLPIVIHSRDADEDMMSILKNWIPKSKITGVIHSFTSSQELAECAIDLGFVIGINGIVTFKNAHNVQAITSWLKLEQMILETDAPFLAPVPYRGKENHPALLVHTAQFVSQLKGISLEELAQKTTENAYRVFPRLNS